VYRRFQGDFFAFGWGRELPGKIFPWRNLSWGKRISIEGAQDFLALLKKNNEKKISTGSNE